jgi:hypothetical protein
MWALFLAGIFGVAILILQFMATDIYLEKFYLEAFTVRMLLGWIAFLLLSVVSLLALWTPPPVVSARGLRNSYLTGTFLSFVPNFPFLAGNIDTEYFKFASSEFNFSMMVVTIVFAFLALFAEEKYKIAYNEALSK